MNKYEEFARRYEESGLTRREFAQSEGISLESVIYYLRRNRELSKGKKSTFVPLSIKKKETVNREMIIKIGEELEIRIPI
ncbi:IS66 family insertion sequence element accessory protein TnpA [Membranihabitans marinus]|uniref:IS66 family insertion sequence element accessory protein TnpA n=1 Tax=Membranihabitans marinus TaxID=1227546 RepID=UPI001F21451B|nr:hypothetical protein [Membranihabitans marinus]